MKLKPIPESPDDKCVCGHTRKEHYKLFYENNPTVEAARRESHGKWFRENNNSCAFGAEFKDPEEEYHYCGCDKYLDRRHCKIKLDDPIVQYIMDHNSWNMTDMRLEKIGTAPTISRRVQLLEFLGAVERSGYLAESMYDLTARCIDYQTNQEIFNKLIDEGIIA